MQCSPAERTNKPCDQLLPGDDVYIQPEIGDWISVYHLYEMSTDGYEEWKDYDHYYSPETRPKTGLVM